MSMMAKRWRAAAAAVVLLAASLHPAIAADATEDDPYNFSVGAFFVTNTNGTIRLDTTSGLVTIGTSIDWERDLGGDTSMTVPRIDGYYRFAPKHRVDFSWYRIDRGGQVVTPGAIAPDPARNGDTDTSGAAPAPRSRA